MSPRWVTGGCWIAAVLLPLMHPACSLGDGTPADVGGVLPPGMTGTWLVRFAKPLTSEAARDARFALDAEGHAWLTLGDTMVLARPEMDPAIDALRIAGVDRIDDAAWMPGGALLVISGTTLGQVGENGFAKILDLPSAGMRIEPASAEECYLFGGTGAESRGDVYLYRKGGGLLRLVRSQQPVTAVAGSGRFTFFAVGPNIFVHADGEPVRTVYAAGSDVTSLALVPPSGVLYTTAGSVGYVSRPGHGFAFFTGKDGRVRVHGREFYVLFPGLGLLRGSPTMLLDRMVWDRLMTETGGALTDGARTDIQRGVEAIQRKQPADAVAHFMSARQEAPYAAEVLLDLALGYEAQGGREIPAMVWYRAYLAAAPEAADVPMVRAKVVELTARVQANVRRLRLDAMLGLLRASAEATGDKRDQLLWSLARAQVALDDVGGARGTHAAMANAWSRDNTLEAIGLWHLRHGDTAGAAATAASMSDKNNSRFLAGRIAAEQAKAGAVEVAIATLRSACAPQAAEFDWLADELLADGKTEDAVKVAKAGGTSVGLSRVYAGVALAHAKAGRLDEARHTVAMLGVTPSGDATVNSRLAQAQAALGEFDEARRTIERIPFKESFLDRSTAVRALAQRLGEKGDIAGARKLMSDMLVAADAQEKQFYHGVVLSQMYDVLRSIGDLDGAEAAVWLIEDEYLRRVLLGMSMQSRGKVREGEIETWAQTARVYEANASYYLAADDLRGWFESKKGGSPEDAYNGMLTAAGVLESALANIAATETRWQGYRAHAK